MSELSHKILNDSTLRRAMEQVIREEVERQVSKLPHIITPIVLGHVSETIEKHEKEGKG